MPSPAGISGNDAVSRAIKTVLASLENSKAENIVSIDIQGKSSLGDYMVVASGRSHRHVSAVADHLLKALKDAGLGKARVEGLAGADWVLIDSAISSSTSSVPKSASSTISKRCGRRRISRKKPSTEPSDASRPRPDAGMRGGMKIAVHAVGRMKAGPEQATRRPLFRALRQERAGRGPRIFRGRRDRRKAAPRPPTSVAAKRRRNCRRSLRPGTALMLLDERGKNFSSEDFAGRSARCAMAAAKALVIAIGGADGHDQSLRDQAELMVSFGALTWPHQTGPHHAGRAALPRRHNPVRPSLSSRVSRCRFDRNRWIGVAARNFASMRHDGSMLRSAKALDTWLMVR